MNSEVIKIQDHAIVLAKKLSTKHQIQQAIVKRLIELCEAADGQDALVMHSPGGWGSAELKELIDWEASIVEGVKNSINQLGLSWSLSQHLRSKNSKWGHLLHLPEQLKYGMTGEIHQAVVLAAELEFVRDHSKNLKILLLGASQGAAFNNSVMNLIKRRNNIYSIELGMFFAHVRRRVITENTLSIDSNGLVPDPVVNWNFKKALKAYVTAPVRWVEYRIAGKKVKFTYCINVPGHEYQWDNILIRDKIINFIEGNFAKNTATGG